jgi:ceramide glucosyltransferase
MSLVVAIVGWVLIAMAGVGTLYVAASAVVLRRFLADASAPRRSAEGVTMLKPLFGSEPRLFENLSTFLVQDHDGPIQLLCGVHSADDPAVAVVAALRRAHPDARIDLVVDAACHGSNGKVSNLINMAPHIAHPIVVLSDSDMAVGPNYCASIIAALDAPGVGAVTLFYYGRGDAGFWSRFGACGLSWQFFPGAVFGVAMKLASPSMGSTVALRRDTLESIGGFAPFANVLADDYALGEAIRGLGLTMAVPKIAIAHASSEASVGALWRHELRWGATIRCILPIAYAASVIGLPLPLAALGALIHPLPGAIVAVAAIGARLFVAVTADRKAGVRTAPLWWSPFRDVFSFAVFVASFFVRSVDWRGATLRMETDGRVSAATETPSP